MRIVIVSSWFPSSADEEPVFPAVWHLANGLVAAGHDVLVVCPSSRDTDREGAYVLNGVRVFKVRVPTPPTLFAVHPKLSNANWLLNRASYLFKAAEAVVDEFRPDILETQEFFGLGLSFLAQSSCPTVVRCYGAACVMQNGGHWKGYSEGEIKILEGVEYTSLLLADGLVAICQDLADELSGLTGRERSEFAIIRTPYVVPAVSKKSYELEENGPRLMFWGQVARLKGADVLIDALPAIAKVYPTVKVSIVGREVVEYGEDVPYGETLKKRLLKMGLLESVEFLGFLPREEIIERALATDVAIFPSRYETACYSAIEAMSYAVPVVASRVGGLKEYCTDQEAGLLFKSEDKNDLAEKVLQMLSNFELRKSLAQQARHRLLDFCSITKLVDETLVVYERAKASRKSAGPRSNEALRALLNQLIAAAQCPDEWDLSAANLNVHSENGAEDGQAISSGNGVDNSINQAVSSDNQTVSQIADYSAHLSAVPSRVLARELARRIKRRIASKVSS